MQLEYELDRLLSKPKNELTQKENELIDYLFDRCNRLWNKIYSKTQSYRQTLPQQKPK